MFFFLKSYIPWILQRNFSEFSRFKLYEDAKANKLCTSILMLSIFSRVEWLDLWIYFVIIRVDVTLKNTFLLQICDHLLAKHNGIQYYN